MTKDEICSLLNRMCTTENVKSSAESISWQAHREAERIADPSVFPILHQIITERNGVRDKKLRRAAYFVLGKVLKNVFDEEYLSFFIKQLRVESDKQLISAILDRLCDIDIPPALDIGPIIAHAKSQNKQVRRSAICALGSSSAPESIEALKYYLLQTDEKEYGYEIIYANAALGKVGCASDIYYLQRHVDSRKSDIRESARFAIEKIKTREQCSGNS